MNFTQFDRGFKPQILYSKYPAVISFDFKEKFILLHHNVWKVFSYKSLSAQNFSKFTETE